MYLLPPNEYQCAVARLKEMPINNLFARSVVEGHVDGKVYVDSIAHPRAFHVVHPYGMSLLYGEVDDEFLESETRDYLLGSNGARTTVEWLQVYPSQLESRIDKMLGGELRIIDDTENCDRNDHPVVKHKRVNFKFNRNKYDQFRSRIDLGDYRFMKVDESLYHGAHGSVVPKKFWNKASEFLRLGVGFALMMQGQAVAIAFSSFIHDHLLEIGLETRSDYRRRGFAGIVSARLVDHGLERGMEPVWSCRRGNQGSYHLAVKLGFEPVAQLPYYELRIK